MTSLSLLESSLAEHLSKINSVLDSIENEQINLKSALKNRSKDYEKTERDILKLSEGLYA